MAIAALYTYSPARFPSKPFPSPSSLECLPDDLRGKREEQLGESLSSQPHRVSKFFLKKEEQIASMPAQMSLHSTISSWIVGWGRRVRRIACRPEQCTNLTITYSCPEPIASIAYRYHCP